MASRSRLRQLCRRLDSAMQISTAEYDMQDTIGEKDRAIIEAIGVYVDMREAVAIRMGRPHPDYADCRGGTPLPIPRDYALEHLGHTYMREQFGQLACQIALQKRGYPDAAVAIFAPRLAEILEAGLEDENGEPFLDFSDDEVGSVD
jgi:hypothetical protein